MAGSERQAKGLPAIVWDEPVLRLIDQRKLPTEVEYVTCRTPEEVADAIRLMVVRGAPAIGATAAYGIAIGAKQLADVTAGGSRGVTTAFPDDRTGFHEQAGSHQHAGFHEAMERIYELMAGTRPTAVNLFWAIERMKRRAEAVREGGPEKVAAALLEEAHAIFEEDIAVNRRIGEYGAELIPQGAGVLTHCNTGSLATVSYGTALGVIRAAHQAGKGIHVYASET